MGLVLRFTFPLAIALALGACGDDEDNGNGGAGGGGGGGNTEQCKGVYRQWTEAELAAETTSGACVDDVEAVCGRDLNTEAGLCGQQCYAEHMDDAQALAACALSCLKVGSSPDPSDACLSCYLGSVECVRMNCLAECVSDPNGATCIDCRADRGCTDAFHDCSGLPPPSPAP